ncbi:MAG: iron-sulfur cluster repair di-iron protein [Acidimicrobiales bacterium]
MTDLAPRTTLGDIVTSQPAAARVLERFGLDYCCGGTATLGAACAERGVDRAEVEAALADLGDPAPADWAHMSAVEMVDHLEATHHAYLCVELERLHRLADKVEAVHGERHPELAEIRSTFAQLRADLEPHLLKEERVLFPMIRELATATEMPDFHCGTLRNPISVMLREHDRAGELLAQLRSLTSDYTAPADGCASYRALFDDLERLEADTHLHVHKENNLLFPAVVAMENAVAR